MSDPKEIWLQADHERDPVYEGRTWCSHPIEEDDTRYIRSDLYDALLAKIKRLEALPEKWRGQAMGWGVESYDDCANELEAALEADYE